MPRNYYEISDKILKDIDNFCMKQYDDGHRKHLGASIIGDKCKAKLWFTFRWVYHHIHSGRIQRLFNTGHMEEIRIINWLRGAGYDVIQFDENEKQIRITDVENHFGGSIDGKIFIPDLNQWCLLECKTNKTGPDFKAFFEERGFEINKPKHWAQTCTYGHKLGLEYVVYICKNKDNDDLFIQVEKLDLKLGQEMITKAKEIIYSRERPARIAETAAYFECKYCDFVEVCHKKKPIEKNCRSCKFAEASENGKWRCHFYKMEIPDDFIKSGCDSWVGVI